MLQTPEEVSTCPLPPHTLGLYSWNPGTLYRVHASVSPISLSTREGSLYWQLPGPYLEMEEGAILGSWVLAVAPEPGRTRGGPMGGAQAGVGLDLGKPLAMCPDVSLGIVWSWHLVPLGLEVLFKGFHPWSPRHPWQGSGQGVRDGGQRERFSQGGDLASCVYLWVPSKSPCGFRA